MKGIDLHGKNKSYVGAVNDRSNPKTSANRGGVRFKENKF